MDFQQGLITTIHEYGLAKDPVSQLNKDLLKRPTSILIPCLFDEFSRPALKLIRSTLKELRNLNQLVIALSASNRDEVIQAKDFFKEMPYPVHVQLFPETFVLSGLPSPVYEEVSVAFQDPFFDLVRGLFDLRAL